MEEKTFNETKNANRFALMMITVCDVCLLLGYIADYLQGHFGIGFLMLIVMLVLVNLGMSYVVYFKQKDSKKFQYVSLIGYFVLYTPVMLGSVNDLMFAIVFPIMTIYVLYYNYKLIVGAAIAFATINVADVVYCAAIIKRMHSGNPLSPTLLLVQIAATIIFWLDFVRQRDSPIRIMR